VGVGEKVVVLDGRVQEQTHTILR